ncbi:MAG: ABC transporter permease [Fuerstiella sp.]
MMSLNCERRFWLSLQLLAFCFAGVLLWILASMAMRVSLGDVVVMLMSDGIQSSVKLSIMTSSISAAIATLLSVPIGYVLARRTFFAKWLVEAICIIPISAPPLVFGLALLIFFQSTAGQLIEANVWKFTFQVSGIVLCQCLITSAYAIQWMQTVFHQQSNRPEQIALTLGCNRWGAFFRVTIPEARPAITTVALMAWAHCMGVFGPILVFAGMIRGRTEVLSTTIWLELQSGNLEAAIVASLLLIVVAVSVTAIAKRLQLSIGRSAVTRSAATQTAATPAAVDQTAATPAGRADD